MATGFKTLENRYGIRVVEERWFNPLIGRMVTTYKMFSADGCPWEKGLSRAGVKAECERWSEQLLQIKNRCAAARRA